ncbi:CLUMA_CG013643, isoform A [Clunio marinus]|uniref:CLUMA_CG013643, isoform A n=1 Tax=Clunio marinus TaxID=568069 RepID=A0A1J1IJF4_9DIPT|nr:CLUMA_CG013643, isoform A [Clunio marinus]
MIIFAVIIVVGVLIYLDIRKPKNFPKGPSWLPIIGSALSIKKSRNETGMLVKGVKRIAEHYPDAKDVIGFKIGKDKVVITHSTEALIEMYTNPDIDGRPYGPFYETRTWNLRRGVLLTDGEFWQTQRRFIQRHLKEFGYARKGMQEICENEAEFCLNDFRNLITKKGGKSAVVTMPNYFSLYVLNTLWLMMAGIRYNSDHDEMKLLQHLLFELFTNIDMMGATFSHFPFLIKIAPEASGYKSFLTCHTNIHKFFSKEVEKHKRNFHPSDEPRNLIDAYLKVLYSGDENGTADESFSELQLLALCLDMFMAGSETTNKSVNFMFLHLVRNPQIQQKCREEIDRIIGRNRLPSLDDRIKMPYCEAVVLESLRFFMKNTFGIPHRALRDTKLCSYHIPKDTMVLSMFYGIFHDERIFKDPTSFDPGNFLDENEKLSIPDKFYPFALGKHRCIGESLAKSNLFLLCTTIIQNFHLNTPPGHDKPSDVPIEGATPSVQDYQALITPRL